MTVIDASAMLEILGRTQRGIEIEAALIGAELHAPHLIDLEVLHTLRRWVLSGMISLAQSEQSIKVFLAFDIKRHTHTILISKIWALRHNLSAYDASYLALAEALSAELVTMDSGLRTLAERRKPN